MLTIDKNGASRHIDDARRGVDRVERSGWRLKQLDLPGKQLCALPAPPRNFRSLSHSNDTRGIGHGCQQRFETACAVIALTINEERWRAVYSGAYSALKIFSNTIGMGGRNHFLNETCFVQAEPRCIFRQRFVAS